MPRKSVPAQFVVTIPQAEYEMLKGKAFRVDMLPFTNDLGNALLTMLATIPYADWPEIAKVAFKHVERKTPTAAYIYKANLPAKEN